MLIKKKQYISGAAQSAFERMGCSPNRASTHFQRAFLKERK
jgi:hypothetical protein